MAVEFRKSALRRGERGSSAQESSRETGEDQGSTGSSILQGNVNNLGAMGMRGLNRQTLFTM